MESQPGADSAHAAGPEQDELWLGYDGLLVPFASISALLVYQPAWDRRIAQAYGQVPGDVQAVVLLDDGRMLPARRALADLQSRWSDWQVMHPDEASDVAVPGADDADPPPNDDQ